jgi:hypothetical protein
MAPFYTSYVQNQKLMKRRIFATTALICCFIVCLAVAADLNGKWTGIIKTPDGNDLQINYVFKVDGDKLTGTAQGDGDPAPIDSGKIVGNDFSFSVSNPQGMVFKQTGRYYPQGDSIGVNIEFGDNKLHSTLKRAGK